MVINLWRSAPPKKTGCKKLPRSDWYTPLAATPQLPETDAVWITKLEIQMFHDQTWKPFVMGQMNKRQSPSHENISGMGLYTLVSVGFFWFNFTGYVVNFNYTL